MGTGFPALSASSVKCCCLVNSVFFSESAVSNFISGNLQGETDVKRPRLEDETVASPDLFWTPDAECC